MSVIAHLQHKNPDKDLGKWEFISLPKEGDYLGVRINDEAKAMRVDAVLHSPVQWPGITAEKVQVPSVMIMVSTPSSDEVSQNNE